MTPHPDHLPAILVFAHRADPEAGLRAFVDDQGFEIHEASTPDELEQVLSSRDIQMTLLDMGGEAPDSLAPPLNLCLRQRASARSPIIVTGTRNTVSDRVAVLDLGADRYLPHPFSQRELLAHMRALSRATHAGANYAASRGALGDMRFCGWTLQPGRHRLITPGGDEVVLTHREFRLLETFARHPRTLLTRPFLKEAAGIDDTQKTARIVDLAIHRLRQKLRQGLHGDTLIHTRHDKGYVFTAAVAPAH